MIANVVLGSSGPAETWIMFEFWCCSCAHHSHARRCTLDMAQRQAHGDSPACTSSGSCSRMTEQPGNSTCTASTRHNCFYGCVLAGAPAEADVEQLNDRNNKSANVRNVETPLLSRPITGPVAMNHPLASLTFTAAGQCCAYSPDCDVTVTCCTQHS